MTDGTPCATEVAGFVIPDGCDLIQTSGFCDPGKGAARYTLTSPPDAREQAAGLNFWLFTTNGGAKWWRLNEPLPTDLMFGVHANATIMVDLTTHAMTVSGHDDTAALQAALDYTIYFSTNGRVLRLPFGARKITNTVHVGFMGLVNCQIEGDCDFPYNEGQTNPTFGVGIVATFNDRPAVNITNGRRVNIRNLSVVGVNSAWMNANEPLIADRSDRSAYFGPSMLPSTTDTRYSPYAGIAIDGYSGPRDPTYHYPDAMYPAWAGAVGQYSSGYSSQTVFEHVAVHGFEVGIAVQPNNMPAASNGDFVRWIECNLVQNIHAVSVCHADARVLSFDRTMMHQCYVALEGLRYGQGQGNTNANFLNCSFDNCYCFLNVDLGTSLQSLPPSIKFQNCYAEAAYSIGPVARAATIGKHTGSLIIEGCQFNFFLRSGELTPTMYADGKGVVPSDISTTRFGGLFGPLTLNGPIVRFEACSQAVVYWPFENDTGARVAEAFAGFLWGPSAKNVSGYPHQRRTFEGFGHPVALVDGDAFPLDPVDVDDNQGNIVPWWVTNASMDGYAFPPPRVAPTVIDLTAYPMGISGVAGTGNEFMLTFATDRFDDPSEPAYYIGPGDVLEHRPTGLLYYVKTATWDAIGAGHTVTARVRQFNRVYTSGDGSLWSTDTSLPYTSGLLYIHNARRCYPGRSKRLIMTTTAASGAVTFAEMGTENSGLGYPPDLEPLANQGPGGLYPYLVATVRNARTLQDTVFPKGQLTAMNTGTGVGAVNQNARRAGVWDAPWLIRVLQ